MDDQTASVDKPTVDEINLDSITPDDDETTDSAASTDKESTEEQPVAEASPLESGDVVEEAPVEDAPVKEISSQESASSEDASEKMQWFVLKVQSNREKSIRLALLRRIKREKQEEYFGEVIIPTEKVAETKNGKKRITEVKLYPGYIMIQMILNDESWYLVRDTNGVGDFTGAAGKPIPMQESEIKRMLGDKDAVEAEPKKMKIDLSVGETVKIKEGGFESFEGSVDSIDDASGKITVLVEIFGRSTPVELEYWQVEKI